MARIKINKKQYDTILLSEEKERLEAPKEKLIKEGTKEVVLGIGMMLGLNLTGQNDAMAHEVISSPAIMSEIKSTIENEDKTKELVELLIEKGMKNPEEKLSTNASKIVKKYNELATSIGINEKITVKGIYNLKSLDPNFKG